MFRKIAPSIGTGTGGQVTPRDDQYEYSPTYLARTRRMLFLRGLIVGWPSIAGMTGRSDQFSPVAIMDDIIAMNHDDPVSPIYLVIDSIGGFTDAGMLLYDVIRMSHAPVITIACSCASMATVLMVAGKERLALPHSRFMLHLPSGGVQGDAKEVKLRTEEMGKTMASLVECYIECGATAGLKGKSEKAIKKRILDDIDREYWIGTDEAIAYGLIDRVVSSDELFGLFKTMKELGIDLAEDEGAF